MFCQSYHKLIIEIDKDDYLYYGNDEIRQKLIENQGFTFIRINPDPDSDPSFDPYVEIAKICNHINKSSVELAVILAKNL